MESWRERERALEGEIKLQSHISSLIGIHVARLARAKSLQLRKSLCVCAHLCVLKEGLRSLPSAGTENKKDAASFGCSSAKLGK